MATAPAAAPAAALRITQLPDDAVLKVLGRLQLREK